MSEESAFVPDEPLTFTDDWNWRFGTTHAGRNNISKSEIVRDWTDADS